MVAVFFFCIDECMVFPVNPWYIVSIKGLEGKWHVFYEESVGSFQDGKHKI